MRRFLLLSLIVILSTSLFAQLTGTKTVGGTSPDYATIELAIADLNLNGVGSGGVTFNVAAGHTETPTADLVITATGTSGNPIVFQKSGVGAKPIINRVDIGLLTTSSLGADGDAIIKVLGGDYFTFDGIDVTSTDQGIEYGYYLNKASATDGCQYITIKNSNITMTKGTSGYVIGIHLGNGSTSVSSATGVTVSAATGINSSITIIGNTIKNVHVGILARGSSATGFFDNNLVVGNSTMGNTITNYGGGSATASYAVYTIYQLASNISYNSINNTSDGGTAFTSTGYGIMSSTAAMGTFTCENNNINVSSVSGQLYAIYNAATGNATYNANTISIGNSATSSSAYGFIYNAAGAGSLNTFTNNIFGTSTIYSTGSTYCIYNSTSQLTPGVTNISGNSTSGTINRTGGTGSFYFYYSGASPTNTENVYNNTISNITLAGSSTFYGFYYNTASGQTYNIYNNTISNISGGTGVVYGIYASYANTKYIYENTIHSLSGGGTVGGIYRGSGTNAYIYKNNIYNLSSSSTGTTVGTVYGILLSASNNYVYNNFISDLKAPSCASLDAIRAINITSTTATTTNKLYYNTIYLIATSTGANFGTSGIFHTYSATATSAVLDMRNNIVVNNSTPNGTGVTAAFRRSAATNLGNLSNDCNNNNFYAGTPSATKVIFYDGTTGYQTLGDYKTLVSTRESASVSENPPFINIATAPYDLHLNTTTANQCESGGQTIATYDTDFDGDYRFGHASYTGAGTSTDLGADEFAGVKATMCSGTPATTTITGVSSVCDGTGTNLALANTYTDLGITYQWKYAATTGGPYTNLGTFAAQATGNLSATTYFVCDVICTNTNDTMTTVEKVISIDALPAIIVTPNTANYCSPSGDPITLTASGASVSYAWSPAAGLSATSGTSVDANPSATTTYTVTGTGANTCINTATATINVSSSILVSATATPDIICSGTNSQLQSSATPIQGGIIITEVTTFRTGTGATASYPAYVIGQDLVEISNITSVPIDVSGWTLKDYANNTATVSHAGFAFPSGTIIPANSVAVVCIGTGTNDPANLYFNMGGTNDGWSSTSVYGLVLANANGIVDVVGRGNPYTFHPSTGVVASDWAGTIVTTSAAGIIRTAAVDNNSGSDWVISTASVLQTMGTFNSGYTIPLTISSYTWTPITNLGGAEGTQNPIASGLTSSTDFVVSILTTGGCSASDTVSVTVSSGPAITTQPTAQSECAGATATFTVAATGPGLTYQWRKNSIAIDGLLNTSALNDTLILTGITSADQDNYDVIVSSTCGTPVTSNAVALTVKPVPTAGIVTNSPICEAETITLTGSTNIGTSYAWTGPNGYTSTNLIDSITGATLAAGGTYQFAATLNGCTSTTANATVVVNRNPTAVVITPASSTFCIGTIETLAATGGQIIVPNAIIGTGISTNDDMSYPTPYGAYYETARTQYLFTSAELIAQGIAAGKQINSIAFDVATLNGSGVHTNYTIKIGHSSVTALTTTYETSATSTVFGPSNYTPMTGLNTHNFTSPFTYDGTSNLIIDICFANDPTGTGGTLFTSNASVKYTATAFSSSLSQYTDNAEFCSHATGITSTNRANISFGIVPEQMPITWSSTIGLYTDATATSPYTGTNSDTVYSKPSITTTYTATATSSAGCVATDDVLLTVNPLPTATTTIATASICIGDSTQLVIDLTGTGPWTLIGTDGTTPETFTGITTTPFTAWVKPSATTTYSITSVTDANCSNTSTAQTVVTVNTLPTISMPTLADVCVDAASFTLTGATPTGGIWSGTGVTVINTPSGAPSFGPTTTYNFSPATAGAASHTLTYTYTDGNGCTNSNTTAQVVNALPVISMPTLSDVCVDATSFALTGATPTGGTWSGTGVTTNNFDPATAGAASHTLTYTFTDGNGCTNSNTTAQVVNALPVISMPSLSDVCVDAASFALTGATPTGGTWTGTGVTTNNFSPSTAGAASHTLTYTFTDGNGCTNSSTTAQVVNALPVISMPTLTAKCVDAASFALTGATPTGGAWSGTGVTVINTPSGAPIFGPTTSYNFNPATAGAASHTLTYTYTDGSGCTNSSTTAQLVNALPVISMPTLPAVCASAASFALTGATPTGGTWSGTGVTTNNFSPATAGAASHTLTYSFTDGNSCANSSTTAQLVNALPVVFAGADKSLPYGTTTSILDATASGAGTLNYSWTPADSFAVSNILNPTTNNIYSSGVYTLQVTDDNCINTDQITLTVTGGPLSASPTASEDTICYGDSTLLSSLASGGSGSFTYLWSNGVGADENVYVHPTTSTTYTLTVNDGYNQIVKQVSVTVNQLPTINMPTLADKCIDATSFALTGATPTGGTWSGTGVTTNSFYPATAGAASHTLAYTYTDGNGCTNSSTTAQVVNALPVISMPTLADVCVDAASFALTGATPTGGTWSGTGVTTNNFDPATAGAASHTLTYTFTDGNGCTNSSTTAQVVNSLPVIGMPTLADVCVDAASFALTGATPTGGTWSGTGVTTNNFDPATAGAASHTLTYTFTDGNGCTNSSTTAQVVNALPVISLPTLADVCVDAASFALTGATPTGGTWSGTGVTTNNFDPATAGAASHTLTYTFTDGNGCTNSSTTAQVVNALPVIGMPTLADVCVDAASFALTGATPTGGTWSGTGVTTNNFDPATAGAASHTLTYTFTDGNGCTNSSTTAQVVNALPVIGMPTLADVCVDAASFALTGATPTGGTWSGTGVTTNNFDPATAGAASHTLTYTFTDGNGCTNSSTTAQVVNALPVIGMPTLADVCVDAASFALTGATPTGGTWSGTGVTTNNFDPATAGAASHTLTYTFTDGNGCTNSSTTAQVVNALPVIGMPTLADVCVDAASFALTGATPTGGTWSGTGVTTNNFDPATAGAASHTLTYTFTDGNGCTNSSTTAQMVNGLPVLSIQGLDAAYCVDGIADTLLGAALGGAGSSMPTTYCTATSGNSSYESISSVSLNGATQNSGAANYTNNTSSLFTALNAGSTYTLSGTFVNDANEYMTAFFDWNGNGTFEGSESVPVFTALTNTTTFSVPVTVPMNAISGEILMRINLTYGVTPAACGSFSYGEVEDYKIKINAPSIITGTFTGSGMSGNIFTPSVAGAGSKVITFSYTDGNGCSNSTTDTTTVNSLPVLTLPTLTAVCVSAPSFALTGATPTGGSWSGNGVSTNSFVAATAGANSHYLKYSYTDANNCSKTDSTSIIVNALPVVSFSGLANAYCANETGSALVGVPSGGTYSGVGINGSNFDPSVNGAGSVAITYHFTDAMNCTDSTTLSTTINPVYTPVFTGLDSSYCVNDTISTLVPDSVGGIFYGTAISGSSFNPALAGIGNYDITYKFTNAFGCVDSVINSTLVNGLTPVTLSGLAAAYCINAPAIDTLFGLPAGGTFIGAVVGNVFDPSLANVGSSNDVMYSYTDLNGCTNLDTLSTFINALPSISLPASYLVCANDTVTLDPGQLTSYTYLWTNGDTTTTLAVDSSYHGIGVGTYTVTVTDANTNCVSSASSDITFEAFPVINIPDTVHICGFDPVSITAGTNIDYIYNWSNGGSSGTIVIDSTLTGTGYYNLNVIVTSPAGCSESKSFYVIFHPEAEVNLGPDSMICITGTLTLDAGAGYSYLWSNNATTQTIDIVGNTVGIGLHNYSVTVERFGCTASDNVNVLVNACIGIEEYEGQLNISIYPNPNQGLFNVEVLSAEASDFLYNIYDMTGKQIESGVINSDGKTMNTHQFDLRTLAKGVYFFKIQNDNIVKIERIVIQ
jgi:hypothetical protein